MRFRSTRGRSPTLGFSQALLQGIAPDGGLYVPEAFPRFTPEDFEGSLTASRVARRLLAPLVAGDALEAELATICDEAFSFPMPLVAAGATGEDLFVLELFHGPTAAFKDVGARFLAACFQRLNRAGDKPLTILVATSGDTGGAVAAAFHRRPNTRVVVLYPRGLVSGRQERQLTCWGDNVLSLRVNGNFDDCQRLVKEAFASNELNGFLRLSSANSINLGRLLPQAVYYAVSSLEHWRRSGEKLNFIIPTGNLGNAQACIWARSMGLPIGRVVLATNANRTITDYLVSGQWQPAPSVPTLASAMDVGNPSNMERLRDQAPELDQMRKLVRAYAVTDEQIREQIRRDETRRGHTWCPHTATAAHVYDHLPPADRALAWALVATAHPAKFETIVEPLVGHALDVPASLARLLDLPSQVSDIDPNLEALSAVLK